MPRRKYVKSLTKKQRRWNKPNQTLFQKELGSTISTVIKLLFIEHCLRSEQGAGIESKKDTFPVCIKFRMKLERKTFVHIYQHE